MYERKQPTIACRPTKSQLETLEQWCATHPDDEGNTPPLAEALRAAIDALAIMERRRAQTRDRKKARQAAEARIREAAAQLYGPAQATCPGCQQMAPAKYIQCWGLCETCMRDMPF